MRCFPFPRRAFFRKIPRRYLLSLVAFLFFLPNHACLPLVERRCDDALRGTPKDACCFRANVAGRFVCAERPANASEPPMVCRGQRCVETICSPGDLQACPFTGKPGATPFTCQPSYRVCVDLGTRWSDCVGGIAPQTEICDGLDNDCDGSIDEGSVCECSLGTPPRFCLSHPRLPSTSKSTASFYRSGLQFCLPSDPEKAKLPNYTGGFRWGSCLGQSAPAAPKTPSSETLDSCSLLHVALLDQGPLAKDARHPLDDSEDASTSDLSLCPCSKEGDKRPCLGLLRFSCTTDPAQKEIQACSFASSCKTATLLDSQGQPRPEGFQICTPHPKYKHLVWSSCRTSAERLREQSDYKSPTFPPDLEQGPTLSLDSQTCNAQDDDCDGFINNICGLYKESAGSKQALPIWEACNDGSPGVRLCRQEEALCKPASPPCLSLCLPQEICDNGRDDDGDGKIDESPCEAPSVLPASDP